MTAIQKRLCKFTKILRYPWYKWQRVVIWISQLLQKSNINCVILRENMCFQNSHHPPLVCFPKAHFTQSFHTDTRISSNPVIISDVRLINNFLMRKFYTLSKIYVKKFANTKIIAYLCIAIEKTKSCFWNSQLIQNLFKPLLTVKFLDKTCGSKFHNRLKLWLNKII